ncbi:MAG TPA: hypothetical protein VGG08_08530 [Solirubrobacteraceae bacterium]|jgi:hypothetical protein
MAADAVAEAPEEQQAPEAETKKEQAKPKKDAKAKGKSDAKGKGKSEAKAAPEGAPSIAAHPRAVRSIARVKGWSGLAGFVIAGYLSLPTSTFAGTGLRAIVAGLICYVAGWGAAVFAWRRLVVLELKAREQILVSELLARAGASGGGQTGARDAP